MCYFHFCTVCVLRFRPKVVNRRIRTWQSPRMRPVGLVCCFPLLRPGPIYYSIKTRSFLACFRDGLPSFGETINLLAGILVDRSPGWSSANRRRCRLTGDVCDGEFKLCQMLEPLGLWLTAAFPMLEEKKLWCLSGASANNCLVSWLFTLAIRVVEHDPLSCFG